MNIHPRVNGVPQCYFLLQLEGLRQLGCGFLLLSVATEKM